MAEGNTNSLVRNILARAKATQVANDADLEKAYHTATRKAHQDRNEIVTQILGNYKCQQAQRNEYKRKKKPIIFWLLFAIILVTTIAFIVWVSVFLLLHDTITNQQLIALISSSVTYLTSLISCFLIIVKYVFPSGEEKNFNDLVKSIIENDTIQMKNENDYLSNKSQNGN